MVQRFGYISISVFNRKRQLFLRFIIHGIGHNVFVANKPQNKKKKTKQNVKD